jgi:sulfur carrier protein
VQILLNGEPFVTDAATLEALCANLGFGDARIATAVNGSFVRSDARAAVALSPSDEVEIVAPRQGG